MKNLTFASGWALFLCKSGYNTDMHIILTHERADFDAIAAMLGAWLLDETAVPVLPRQINRNVRAFLTLYGGELPFVDPRDLPGDPIEQVWLVDTQSLVTLKGMRRGASVRVIDHHPRRDDLPADWEVAIESVGATTTLLVEALQERNGHFSVAQATLLLLGIYEDTGSLTYAHTTPRDVHAAGWLLEHGASLRLAAEFLNTPLTPAQYRVYEDLVQNAETLTVHGHRIVIACGDARGMADEISSLAHKLRDLLDPDGLFVLVLTDAGVRLVARSTSDYVDVGVIAAALGGGGHDRAAAALIRLEDGVDPDEALRATVLRLKELLPQKIRPAVTVKQLMSRGPQVLSPDTPAQKAAELMTRYGYEGYPVVRAGRVIGLLTRRAVDRALAHKLNLSAEKLMEAGSVTVRPDDSLNTLQRRMMESGWGQIPVVDDDDRVIGIVTRTDLLKVLAPPETPSGLCNLREKLEKSLPPGRLWLLEQIGALARELRLPAYVVGGFVRDLLLDRPSLDFDVVVEGEAIRLAEALQARFGGRFNQHKRFGTAKWFPPKALRRERNLPEFLDLISARTEFYEKPTALPTVRLGSIKLDLHRRDFTINTLAMRLDGRHLGDLYDYWGGLRDLQQGLVRVLHSLSFVDDPTRMMRAVRFEQRFGFRIEERTLELLQEARPLLDRLSGQRVRHEIDLMLDEPAAAAMLRRLQSLGLLAALQPPLPWDAFMETEFAAALDEDLPWPIDHVPGGLSLRRARGYLLWLLPLDPQAGRTVDERLRFPAAFARSLQAARMLWQRRDDLPERPSDFVRAVEDVPLPALWAVWRRLPADSPLRMRLVTYVEKWQHIWPFTTGHDLRLRGLPPGRHYSDILWRLRAAWLDGEVRTFEQEQALLEELLRQVV